jgi:hypothetical protein
MLPAGSILAGSKNRRAAVQRRSSLRVRRGGAGAIINSAKLRRKTHAKAFDHPHHQSERGDVGAGAGIVVQRPAGAAVAFGGFSFISAPIGPKWRSPMARECSRWSSE